MMVLFQRKIIYMGYIPPGSRSEVSVSESIGNRSYGAC